MHYAGSLPRNNSSKWRTKSTQLNTTRCVHSSQPSAQNTGCTCGSYHHARASNITQLVTANDHVRDVAVLQAFKPEVQILALVLQHARDGCCMKLSQAIFNRYAAHL
jgi:hypothetical protein